MVYPKQCLAYNHLYVFACYFSSQLPDHEQEQESIFIFSSRHMLYHSVHTHSCHQHLSCSYDGMCPGLDCQAWSLPFGYMCSYWRDLQVLKYFWLGKFGILWSMSQRCWSLTCGARPGSGGKWGLDRVFRRNRWRAERVLGEGKHGWGVIQE